MPSERPDAAYLWRKACMKTVFTKRYAQHKMSDGDDRDEDDEFTSCFIDDDVSEENDDEGIREVEDEKERNSAESNSKVRSRLSSYNGTTQRLLSAGVPTDDIDSIEPINVSKISGTDVDFLTSIDDDSQGEMGMDFVDMAVTRDHTSSGDGTDMGLCRGDPQQQKRKRSEKYQPHYRRTSPKVKKFEPSVTFGWFDWLIGALAISVFFVDIGTDIELAVHYFRKEMWMYGGVTTGLIVGPSLVTCFLGLHWYIIDYRKEKQVVEKLKKQGRKAYITPTHVWVLRILFTLLQIGPVVRIIEYLRCGYKSQNKKLEARERRRYYRFMLYEDVDSCLLRLFESFLESAPQLTWQLYIVIVLKPKEDVAGTSIRAIALLSSWGSLAISLVSYHKSLRNSHEEKAKMKWTSLPFYFIWRASEIGGRVLCIAMFASAFELWVFGPLAFHWAFMSVWLIVQKTTFYKNACLEKAFNIICGYVMIFCFLNLREGQTRFRFLLFYFIIYIENFFMLAFWFRFTRDLGAWFHLWGFIVVLILFVFHIVFQLLYYKFFHPTNNIQTCLPCDRYIIYASICHEIQAGRDHVVGDGSERYTVTEMIVKDPMLEKKGARKEQTQISVL